MHVLNIPVCGIDLVLLRCICNRAILATGYQNLPVCSVTTRLNDETFIVIHTTRLAVITRAVDNAIAELLAFCDRMPGYIDAEQCGMIFVNEPVIFANLFRRFIGRVEAFAVDFDSIDFTSVKPSFHTAVVARRISQVPLVVGVDDLPDVERDLSDVKVTCTVINAGHVTQLAVLANDLVFSDKGISICERYANIPLLYLQPSEAIALSGRIRRACAFDHINFGVASAVGFDTHTSTEPATTTCKIDLIGQVTLPECVAQIVRQIRSHAAACGATIREAAEREAARVP